MCLPTGSWARWASCKYFFFINSAQQLVPQNVTLAVKCIEHLTCEFSQGPPGPGGLLGEMGKSGPPVSRG